FCLYPVTLLPPPRSTLFPYTTLFRSGRARRRLGGRELPDADRRPARPAELPGARHAPRGTARRARGMRPDLEKILSVWRVKLTTDRKSTRPNSSYSPISYAVFCLKKK